MTSREERERGVAESPCGGPCAMCREYVETGDPKLRPASAEEIEEMMRRHS